MELELTSLTQLQEYAKGQLVQLPDFAEGQPFVARLKRPSLLALAKAGKIPNELLYSAEGLFASSKNQKESTESSGVINEMCNMLDAVCEASFVSPTYQAIKDAGIELTDDQRTFVFQYCQQGVKALDNFRTESRNNRGSTVIQSVQ